MGSYPFPFLVDGLAEALQPFIGGMQAIGPVFQLVWWIHDNIGFMILLRGNHAGTKHIALAVFIPTDVICHKLCRLQNDFQVTL